MTCILFFINKWGDYSLDSLHPTLMNNLTPPPDGNVSCALHFRNARAHEFTLHPTLAPGWYRTKMVFLGAFFMLIWVFSVNGETEPYPTVTSKKGLQVQMVDDALSLGIKHAALNCDLAGLLELTNSAHSISHTWQGKPYFFRESTVSHMDQQIKPLASAGVLVSLIILVYESQNPEVNRLLIHPGYDKKAPNRLGAFNTVTTEGKAAYQACLSFLASRYGSSKSPHGRVVNYIIGNEVNSHWFWSNMGRVSMEQFADSYLISVRAADEAVKMHDKAARIFVSLEHHWNIHYPGGDASQTFAARPFLEYFASKARVEGDFAWHVAFHPYPENLFEPRTWLDKSATFDPDASRITFRNLPLLIQFLEQPALKYKDQPRHVILSEQGFHAKAGAEGELLQAAAYAYAYKQVEALPSIDAFILHRHVDHSHEGGLNLGLWERKADSIATPGRQRKIYEVFQAADTTNQTEKFSFALPIIGITSWDQLKNQKLKK